MRLVREFGRQISASLKRLVIALYVVPVTSSAEGEESEVGHGREIVGGLGRGREIIGGMGTRGLSGGLVSGLSSIESSGCFSTAYFLDL